MRLGDRITGIFVIIIGSFVWIYSHNNLTNPAIDDVDASFFPKVIGGLLIITGVVLMIKTILKNKKKTDQKLVLYMKELIMIIAYALYIFLVPVLGFIITSPLLIIGLAFYLGSKKIVMNVMVGVLVTAGIYFFFQELLSVPLPRGRLF
ncbi:tripartite tricarboxylate transporter TctB family protein [Oceanobacillus timonensis]|uniref:tripartite tricarboxylate transporter TctB family protein n=1 Tax=Oceanobacillus timonensis TaxID=1926285 RepID=UPI0009BAD241|nr:tripartite tricarboxylate transporter TctB family protein [Oceanobacillus timonensis]